MGRFRALKPLQSSSTGLVRPGQEFDWSGSIIGWNVEPLDDEARAMVEERAKRLGGGAEEDKPLPSQPFPKGVMKTSAGMSAPQIVGGTLNATADTPAADASAPQMTQAPRRRASRAAG